jgi:HEAT repeat protein
VLQLALKEGKDYARQSAIKVLQQLGSEDTVPALINALQDSDKTVRLLAAETLGQIGEQKGGYTRFQIIPQLIKTLEDNEPILRWTAAHALGHTHDPDIIPFLLNALRKNKTYVARSIADALLRLMTERSIPVLLNS